MEEVEMVCVGLKVEVDVEEDVVEEEGG